MSVKQSKEVDFEKLQFIRVFTPIHIPKTLIEQVKDRDYSVDEWYQHQQRICTIQSGEQAHLNPLSMLYVISDENFKVVGMLWCEIDTLGKALVVQTFSMDKKYWNRGKAVSLLAKKAKEIAKECKLTSIFWLTNYPKHSEWYGFKRSRTVLMEFDMNEEVDDGSHNDGVRQAHAECLSADTGATGFTQSNPTVSGS